MKIKKTSIADIASNLNLSKSTVSFVLNNKGDYYNISKKTQLLIQNKAKELNYIPNYFAKSLREGKTKTIGLILADISNPFYAELTKVIQDCLYQEGYSLFVVSTNDEEALELTLIQSFLSRSMDALIIAPCNKLTPLNHVLSGASIPIVWIDRIDDDFDNFVGINNYKEAYSLIKCFSKTPKTIGIIKPEHADVTTIQLRIDGLKSACEQDNIPYIIAELNGTSSENATQLKKLMEKNKIDSFVALNNKVALNLFQLLNRLNIQMPSQVRLISFDDISAFSYFSPPITALNQPIEAIGKETAHRVLRSLNGKTNLPKHLFLDCTFVKRGSH